MATSDYGACIYVIFISFLQMPFLQLLMMQPWFAGIMNNLLFSGFIAATVGAIFEQVGRYISFRFFRLPKRFYDSVAFGLGHGGIEALMMIGFPIINSLNIALAVNNGTIYTANASVDKTLIDQAVQILVETPGFFYILSSLNAF